MFRRKKRKPRSVSDDSEAPSIAISCDDDVISANDVVSRSPVIGQSVNCGSDVLDDVSGHVSKRHDQQYQQQQQRTVYSSRDRDSRTRDSGVCVDSVTSDAGGDWPGVSRSESRLPSTEAHDCVSHCCIMNVDAAKGDGGGRVVFLVTWVVFKVISEHWVGEA